MHSLPRPVGKINPDAARKIADDLVRRDKELEQEAEEAAYEEDREVSMCV